ncbi:glutamate racemase [Cohnella thailandensis]|uniref:Glutamate racemase n=1 Tax=Cohnella thailandensis TaxID=557557 RepID=A0A841T5V4_9BACL|nr:glutamate racemase [Cohnella thailandensis]MBP1977491.1 glutamate racemase [Cohnella thailandensis]
MKIGFFDSGVGGLTVLYQALELLPKEDYIFYADTDHVPYGEKPKEEVKRFVTEAVDFIAAQGVKAIVIACNTATSIVIEDLRARYDFPILGIEPAVKPAVLENKERNKKVLVLATRLTLQEEKYKKLVRSLDCEHKVESLPLPGLVELAEAFEFSDDAVLPYLREQLKNVDIKEVGTVVLGCTHFPYFRTALRKLFGNEVHFVDGSVGTAKQLRRLLNNRLEEGDGTVRFYESGRLVRDEAKLSRYRHLMERLREDNPVTS